MSEYCEVCRCLDPDCSLALRPDDGWSDPTDAPEALWLDRNATEIECSGSGGCSTCCAIFEVLLFFYGEGSIRTKVTLGIYRLGHSDIWISGITIQLYTPPSLPPAWNNIYIVPEFSLNPSSDEAFTFIRECLQTCSSKHSICQQRTPLLPKRVLDVSPSVDGLPETIQLVETDAGSVGRYVALSYCWGAGKAVKTTSSNLTLHRNGIPLSKLSLSIKDAVYLTRSLQCQYIWVDALCIIQDSQVDWEEQSAQMASIYRNAYITLAASRAASADDGFLADFNPWSPSRTFSLTWPTDHGTTTTLKARVLHGHGWPLRPEPLDNRGWAYQERLLSTRTLTFSDEEIRWNCKSSTFCECRRLRKPGPQRIHGFDTVEEAYDSWNAIVSQFSDRKLTHPADKLPALSGLAKAIQDVVQSDYIAGLWKGNLISDLAWSVWAGGEGYAEYLAPSFSWVSVNGRVIHYPDRHALIEGCQLVHAEVSVTGQNPFGRVSGGFIQLRGNLIPTILYSSPLLIQDSGQNHLQHRVVFNNKQMDFTPDLKMAIHEVLDENQRRFTSVSRLRRTATPQRLPPEVPTFLFYLGNQERCRNEGMGIAFFLVLGISPCSSTSFERLGLFPLKYDRSTDWPKPLDNSTLATITIV